MNKHQYFVETSITSVIRQAVTAIYPFADGISNISLRDYMLQSLFLQMTGFQEQKLKCICWDLATENFEYRRILLNNADNLGEYSRYEAKAAIYSRMLEMIAALEGIKKDNLDIGNCINKNWIVTSCKDEIVSVFKDSCFNYWQERDFWCFNNHNKLFRVNQFASQSLLETSWKGVYDELYAYRNRCAHNTLSYQDNTPLLRQLVQLDSVKNNFFFWYATLNLIDKVFMLLYQYYFRLVKEKSY